MAVYLHAMIQPIMLCSPLHCHLLCMQCCVALITSHEYDTCSEYHLLIALYACFRVTTPHVDMYMHMCGAMEHIEMYRAEKLFEDA